ncbi:MAG: DUF1499 domain-containing protein [Parvibaculum sp.]|nr:DUF1499 domain-containing protein [Parvibaculum sp.]
MSDQSKTAQWGLRLAVLAIVILALAIIGLRYELLDFKIPLLGLAVAGALGLVALIVSLIGLVITLAGKKSGAGIAIIGLVLAGVAMVPLSTSVIKGGSIPRIHDITTDLVNPPQFVDVVALRASSPNPLDRKDPADLAELQAKAYPALAPLTLNVPAGVVFEAARGVAQDMGWAIVSAKPETGLIEATATTGLLRFKDDVAIRIVESSTGTIVDVRSVSRVGMSDLGTNAARIEAFLAALKAKLAV